MFKQYISKVKIKEESYFTCINITTNPNMARVWIRQRADDDEDEADVYLHNYEAIAFRDCINEALDNYGTAYVEPFPEEMGAFSVECSLLVPRDKRDYLRVSVVIDPHGENIQFICSWPRLVELGHKLTKYIDI